MSDQFLEAAPDAIVSIDFQLLTGYYLFPIQATEIHFFNHSPGKTMVVLIEQPASPFAITFGPNVVWKSGAYPDFLVAKKSFLFRVYDDGTDWRMDITPHEAGGAASRSLIPAGEIVTIPVNYEMLFTDGFTIDGELIIDGDLVEVD